MKKNLFIIGMLLVFSFLANAQVVDSYINDVNTIQMVEKSTPKTTGVVMETQYIFSEDMSKDDQCNIVFEMFDSYGDGWNGASIGVTANGTFIQNVTLSSGNTGIVELMVPVGTVEFSWNTGNWDGECSFNIYDAYQIQIYTSPAAPAAGLFFTWENTCVAPESVTVSGVVTSSLTGSPIQGANVAFQGVIDTVLVTNASGNYSVDLYKDYTYVLKVTADGYNSYIENEFTPAATMTHNVALDNPVLNVDITEVDVETYYQNNGNADVTITNTGNGPLSVSSTVVYEDSKKDRAQWDLVNTITLNSAGQQGVATDGMYIYTSCWNSYPGYAFGKYTLDGEFIEGFDIAGAAGIRDLTYDGTYFYGGNGANIIYQMDLANKTLVGTINTSVSTIRHCSYYAEEDAFFVGNWSDLYKVGRDGATLQTCPGPVSAYGSAIDYVTEGGPYLLIFSQEPNPSCTVYQYDIENGAFTDFSINLSADNPEAIAGGAFIGEYQSKICFFGNKQQDPNVVGIYELGSAGWLSPDPSSAVIAPGESQVINLVMDGSWAEQGTFNATYTVKTSNPDVGAHDIDVTFTILPPNCDAPTNLQATIEDFSNIVLTWTGTADATSYSIYYSSDIINPIVENVTGTTYTFENMEEGEYCYVVKAIYSDGCVSLSSNEACVNVTAAYATVHGVVTDQTGAALSGVTVTFDANQTATTNNSGNYSLEVLSGTYDVVFAKDDYATYTETGFVVGTGDIELNATLEIICNPVQNLTAVNDGNNVITLNWDYPEGYNPGGSGETHELTWAGPADDNAIGTASAADFDVANRFEVSDLTNYVGWTLKTIKFYPAEQQCEYSLRAWTGDNAADLVLDQVVANPIIGGETVIDVESDVVIEPGKEFWIGYRCNTQTGYPAGVDAGPAVEGKGDMIFFDGAWAGIGGMGLNYNFVIIGVIQNAKGETANLVLNDNTNRPSTGMLSVNYSPIVRAPEATRGLEGYKILLEGESIGMVNDPNVTTFEHTYTFTNKLDVEYCVKAVYTNCESESVCATVTVMDAIEDNADISVYPNPANNIVNIAGVNVDVIYIYNNIGQLVDQVRSNQVDVSNYASGLYMFNIISKDGTMSKVKIAVNR